MSVPFPALTLCLALSITGCSGSDDKTGQPGDTGTETSDTDTTTDTDTDTGTTAAAEEAVWLETFSYNWVSFNHRLSYLHVQAANPPSAAVVGGTSTTQQPTDLDPTCDPDSCKEFPFVDSSEVVVGIGEASTTDASFATASADAIVPTAGATVTITAPAPAREGAVSAVLQGFTIDTNYELTGGTACYKPGFGWHPRRIAIELGEPSMAGGELSVDVSFQFVAGNTEDLDRVCIDEVNEQSQVPMSASVLFVVGPDSVAVPVQMSAEYAFSGNSFDPGEQTPPPAIPLGLSGDGIRGWSKLDWTFNPGNAEERGGYLRTLVASIDGDNAAGTSTNFSPITQLHDFAFEFDGVVQGIELEGVTHTTVNAVLPTGTEEDYRPIIYVLDGSTPTE